LSAFSVHGIWTPGVLVMRRTGFTAKSLIIQVVFPVPLLLQSRRIQVAV